MEHAGTINILSRPPTLKNILVLLIAGNADKPANKSVPVWQFTNISFRYLLPEHQKGGDIHQILPAGKTSIQPLALFLSNFILDMTSGHGMVNNVFLNESPGLSIATIRHIVPGAFWNLSRCSSETTLRIFN